MPPTRPNSRKLATGNSIFARMAFPLTEIARINAEPIPTLPPFCNAGKAAIGSKKSGSAGARSHAYPGGRRVQATLCSAGVLIYSGLEMGQRRAHDVTMSENSPYTAHVKEDVNHPGRYRWQVHETKRLRDSSTFNFAMRREAQRDAELFIERLTTIWQRSI